MSPIVLSDEQQRILKEAKAPSTEGSTIRITSAAGTGKTTTLLELANRFSQLGHRSITYITFNKSAAADARKRLAKSLLASNNDNAVAVDARTLHSCAMSLLSKQRREAEVPEERLFNDEQLQKVISCRCEAEISNFLSECYREIAARNEFGARESMRQHAERQVAFFIFKTLRQFCQSSLSEEEWNMNDRKRNYYPCVKYHQKDGDGEKAGFSSSDYLHRVHFYADQACQLWANMMDVKTYDFEMKRAQLTNLEIPGSALLVDECQDMDGCQIEWVAAQVKFNKQVVFVGDAAQTIYSFRGAKSRYMMNLRGKVVDCTLTNSWRFGPAIAKIANTILFAKQKSPHTTGSYTKMWQPYRVTGAGPIDGTVTSEPLLPNWKTQKVTLLAFSNVELLMEAVAMLGYTKTVPNDGDDDDEEGTPVVTQLTPFEPSMIPRFHVNGGGENSGIKKWKLILKQLEHLYQLFTAGDSLTTLPTALFSEFAKQNVSWEIFTNQVQNRELNRYAASVSVVEVFGHDTMKVIQMFEENVMQRNYSADEADVILSTCHAAKGMEWDHVQVCSDFVNLAKFDTDGPPVSTAIPPGKNKYVKRPKGRKSWQFAFKPYGDDVNLLYVACTRAKKTLCVPPIVLQFLQSCDVLQQVLKVKMRMPAEFRDDAGTVMLFGSIMPLKTEDLKNIQDDIVGPLRKECKVDRQTSICASLLTNTIDHGALPYDGVAITQDENDKIPAEAVDDEKPAKRAKIHAPAEVVVILHSPKRIVIPNPSAEAEVIGID